MAGQGMPSGGSGVEPDVSIGTKAVSRHQINGLRGIRWKQPGHCGARPGTREGLPRATS